LAIIGPRTWACLTPRIDYLHLFSFGLPFNIFSDDSDDEANSRLMVDLWANFATYRDPTSKDGENFIGDSLNNLEIMCTAATGGEDKNHEYITIKNAKLGFEADRRFNDHKNFWTQLLYI
jgi:hypothetical protein